MRLARKKSSQGQRNKNRISEYIPLFNKLLDVAKLALAASLLVYAFIEDRKKVESPPPPVVAQPEVIEPEPEPLPPVEANKPRRKPQQKKRKTNPLNKPGNDARRPLPR
jgi:hypothetical protein